MRRGGVEMTTIWYRSSTRGRIPAYEDRGGLILVGGRVTFEGKKQIISGRIRSVGRKQMGMNRWVHVQYDTDGETRDAYFMDGDALGWAGVFGGNKDLAARILAAAHPELLPPG